MTLTELTNEVQSLLPDWCVTLDEAYMMNIRADEMLKYEGFAYIEELNSESVNYGMGRKVTRMVDVYFCRLTDFENTAAEREHLRETHIYPAVRKVEEYLNKTHGIGIFTHDKFPRGFDANEVLVHVSFQISNVEC